MNRRRKLKLDLNEFVNELWSNENPDGLLRINGKGGYRNGRYYAYKTTTGSEDVGPGFDMDFLSKEVQDKARTQGFTKEELDAMARDNIRNEIHFFNQRIAKEGGDTTKVTNDVYKGLLDMYWQIHNGLYQQYPKFWEAVANQDYQGMRDESATNWQDSNGVWHLDNRRWLIRKERYFHDPLPEELYSTPNFLAPLYNNYVAQPDAVRSYRQQVALPASAATVDLSKYLKAYSNGGTLSDYLSYLRKHRIRIQ